MLASTFYLIIGLVAGGVLTAGGGTALVRQLTKAAREKKRLFSQYAAPKKLGALPRVIDTELEGLRKDLERLVELEEFKTATALASVIEMTQELFAKLKHRGDEHQVNMAAVSYGHVLTKLNKALDDNYFFDMIQRPSHWTRVEERKTVVRNVVKAVNGQLLESIREFNSASDFNVVVDLEALLRTNDADDLLKDLS